MDTETLLHWRQGLFLQPQHFQLLERSFHSLLTPYNKYQTPHFWGAVEFKIQESALGSHSVRITQGNFLFPDGALTTFPGNSIIEPRIIDDIWVQGEKPLTVYVGLRRWNSSGKNVKVIEVTDTMKEADLRFVSFAGTEEIKDLHSEETLGQVETMKYVVKLFFEPEKDQLGDYQLIPIARLERISEEIRMSERFIPPTPVLSTSGMLFHILQEILDQILARSRQLEELKRERGVQAAEFGSRDMVYLLALRSLNRYVPALQHFTETKEVHPWVVYGLLRQLIGELSSFSEKVDVMGRIEAEVRALPSYDHENLGECFLSAQLLISHLLDDITAGPDYALRLVYDGTYFSAQLKPQIFEGKNRFYLVLGTENNPKEIISSVESLAKLGSRESLPLLIARALPGIKLEHLPIPPQALPRRAHTVYFAIDYHGEQWGKVKKGNNIALYWDHAPKDLEAELMVVGR